jgi:hypothetical protein
MKSTMQIIAIVVLGILAGGCTKQGPIGPAGPAGAAGNSNVTSTTFMMNNWYWSSPNYYANVNVPQLTASNASSAAVMVYFNTDGSNNWIALPYTHYHTPYNYVMGFNTSVGFVQVTWFYDTSLSSGDDPNTFFGTTIRCKVVVIPPSMKLANPDLDLKDYEMVKKRFKLKD